ncbi:DMT family transporter, partial [Thioclava sp. BHET1]
PNIHFGAGGSGRIAMIGALIVLASAVMTALAQVWLRKFVAFEKVSAIVFYFAISATLLSLLTLPFGWAMPSPRETALLIGAGLFGGTGQILLTSSYREADASLIAPFDYASMLLALAIGYFAFAEIPSWQTLGGASLVVIAGIAIIWRERQLGLERARQRKTATPSGS